MNLIRIIPEYGVNDVFVPGLTYRHIHINKVRKLNTIIKATGLVYVFKFIDNDNMLRNNIGNDNIHLDYSGIVKIADNIIYIL